ncbi:MAG: TonB-dependent receptor [Candidatus Thiodiazotropha lotti]|nr:TonB-dependent receptor [Candidatus Thiodiazotropha lotti]MCG7999087.1 TonB-dependent receptor [Candidatus Thiodiazotropha lotti]MCW4181930.1 TonB-dependent receptor [Candidatus Thiodiazotropha weberae]MCW4190855.1 TonB-dependent receptor [Candidatus Thiodiazotropha weberae]
MNQSIQGLRMHNREHHKPLLLSLFYTGAILSSSSLYGDNHLDNFSEDYFYDELPVVLSATRLSQSQSDTPTAMTVIDRKMIQASTALNIPDLLRLVPGFTVGFYAGSRATVTYHGHADEYARDMQVLINGRSIYDPVYGGIPWSEIPLSLDEILRIEVIRGPNAAAYGSNSYAGVINIVTDRNRDMLGTMISSTIGYGKTRYIDAKHSATEGKLDYSLSASYKEDEGFDNREDAGRTKWLKLAGDYHFNEHNSLNAEVAAVNGDYDEKFSNPLQENRILETKYNYQQLTWDHIVSESNKLSVQFYHNYYEVDDVNYTPTISEQIISIDEFQEFDEELRPDVFTAFISNGLYDFDSLLQALNLTDSPLIFSWIGLESHRYDLEVEHTLEPFDDLRIAWGVGARHDSGKSRWLFQNDETVSRDLYRLFINSEWYAADDIVVNAGTMLEKFEGKRRVLSPRLGINYHLTPENTLRISGSRAYRMPTLFEDNVNLSLYHASDEDPLNTWIISTEDLDPQKIDRIEVGYFGHFTDYGLNFDICLLHEEYSDIIDQYVNFDIPDPDRGITDPIDLAILNQFNSFYQRGAFTYTNFGKVEVNGIEFEMDFRPTNRDLVFLGFSYLNVSGNEIKRLKDGVYSYRENADVKIPQRTFSLLASHAFDDGVTMSLGYYFTDEMQWPGEGDSVPNYSRLDVKFNKRLKLQQSKLDVALILQNIHGKNIDFYNSDRHEEYNIWERRAYVQAKLNY